jgi:hypothetical protein
LAVPETCQTAKQDSVETVPGAPAAEEVVTRARIILGQQVSGAGAPAHPQAIA